MNRRWAGLLFFAATFALYLRTLAPTVAALFDDSLEFQLAGFRLAIAHPTGYPLYTLLLKGFTLIPLGEVAGRANLSSALFAALAVLLVYAAVVRLTGSTVAALMAAGALAVSQVFWSQAVVAEVYALNAVFVAAISLWVIRDAAAQTSHPNLTPLAFLFGLSLTHHRTVILLASAVALYLGVRYRGYWRKRLRELQSAPFTLRPVLAPLLAFALPLLLYLYLPLRGEVGSLDGTYLNTPEGFWRWVTASNYNIFLAGNPFNAQYDTAFFADLFVRQFGALGLAAALLGCGVLVRRGAVGLYVPAAITTNVVFVLNYRVPDVQVFALPAFVLLAVTLGVGVNAVGALLRRWATRGNEAYAMSLSAGVLLGAIFVISIVPHMAAAWGENDLSGKTEVRDMGRDWLDGPLPGDARLVGILGEMTLVRYLQAAEGRVPSLVTMAADRDAERLAVIEREIAAGHAVLTTRPLSGLAEKYALGAQGGLVRVWPTPQPASLPADAPRVGNIKYQFDGVTQPYAGLMRVAIRWEPTAPVTSDLKVSVRLMDGDRLAAQRDDWPVHNAYHTQTWRAGETIHDAYDLPMDPALPRKDEIRPFPPQPYHLLLIVYQANSGAEVGRIDGGAVEIGKP